MQDHNKLIAGLSRQLKDVLHDSKQGIYLYLDDIHKMCNRRFAFLLGYTPNEWAKIDDLIERSVQPSSRAKLINAYHKAVEKMVGSKVPVTWKKKSGATVRTDVIIVPIEYKNQVFALHFVS
jgi:hypothetical protein